MSSKAKSKSKSKSKSQSKQSEVKKSTPRVRLSDKTKREIVRQFRNGSSVQALADEYNVPRSSLYRWIGLYSPGEGSPDVFAPENYYEMQCTIEQLREENRLLKKAIAIISSKH